MQPAALALADNRCALGAGEHRARVGEPEGPRRGTDQAAVDASAPSRDRVSDRAATFARPCSRRCWRLAARVIAIARMSPSVGNEVPVLDDQVVEDRDQPRPLEVQNLRDRRHPAVRGSDLGEHGHHETLASGLLLGNVIELDEVGSHVGAPMGRERAVETRPQFSTLERREDYPPSRRE